MENAKKTSLITTLYNEENNILNFLESYKSQTKYADEFIIVDGGSTDNTVSIMEKFSSKNETLNIKVIVDKTCSKKYVAGPIAKGRNIAIKNAQYAYIAATDAGCVLDKNWYEEIIKPFEDDSIDVVSGWYETNAANEFQREYAKVMMPKLQNIDRENFLPSSRSIAFKKSCWKKVGKYPIVTYTAEDTLFDLNMKKEGCMFHFTEKAFVYWDCPFSLEDAKNKNFSYGYGNGQLRLFPIQFIKRILKIFIPYGRSEGFILRYLINFNIVKGYLFGLIKGVSKKEEIV